MATIVHFDIGVDNLERAKIFYEKLFDWRIEQLPGPMNYYMIATSDLKGNSALGGGMTQRNTAINNSVINYIGVASVDATLKNVIALGGKILQPVQQVPGYGLLAICTDTENNMFGIFEEK